MKTVLAAILGGGQGARLWPLTRHRAKPAVPVGGKFRLIDIPISNCLHADVRRIFVLTQFNSASLHRHIAQTYRFDAFNDGFVNILAAEQSLENRDWYQGTADAVRQNLARLLNTDASEIMILSGDQLYLMDLRAFVGRHRDREADLTIAVQPVTAQDAPNFGVLRVDDSGRLVEFVEKPSDPDVLRDLSLDAATIEKLGLDAEPGSLLASMGMYVFRPDVLDDLLAGTAATDFGKEVIPEAIHRYRVYGYLHRGYWRDIGTIPSFHRASLDLAAPVPPLNLYDEDFPIYTHPRFLPGSKISSCTIEHSVVCDGCRIDQSDIKRSVIGVRARVQEGCRLQDTVLMGANSFENHPRHDDTPALGLGRNCDVRHAIIDLNVRIGDGVKLINEAGIRHADGDFYCIREGIIVVPAGSVVPPGTEI